MATTNTNFKKHKKKKSKHNKCLLLQKCRQCSYFSLNAILNEPYYLDKNGVKHRDIKYICDYDLHEINPKIHICPREVAK